jgi:hypothetical protein
MADQVKVKKLQHILFEEWWEVTKMKTHNQGGPSTREQYVVKDKNRIPTQAQSRM